MTKLLRQAGHVVVEASTVAEGIARLDGQAVALLDLLLPDGSGVEVLKHIRKEHHHTRVAITSAAYDTDEARSLLGPGDALFPKPLDIEKLLRWIDHPATP
jgi:CheY-like chemotaxis protein